MTRNDDARLDCAACRPLLDAFLLDELDPASADGLGTHVAACPACAAELGGLTRLIEALALAPTPQAAPELDERILLAAIADRQRRHEHRSWLRDLRTQVFRGAVRTASTLAVTVITVALVGASLVFAAGNLFKGAAIFRGGGATVAPSVSPTMTSPTTAPSAAAPTGTPHVLLSPVPAPSAAPTVAPTPRPTRAPTASPAPSATEAPSVAPSPVETPSPVATEAPSPTPTPSVGPSPTDKPHLTPPPATSPPSPSATTSP